MNTNTQQPININISTLTIVKVVVFAILLYFLFLIRDIVAILFVSLVFASAVDPWIDWMQKKHLSRGFSMICMYLLLFSFVGAVVYLIVPPITEQVTDLAKNFPFYIDKFNSWMAHFKSYTAQHGMLDNVRQSLGSLSENLNKFTGGVVSTVTSVFGGIMSFFLVLVITFYMVVEENAIKKIAWSLTPEKNQAYVIDLINRMQKKIGLWLRGQLILCLVIFTLTYIGLSILGVKYALVLALIAGITEAVPYLGPTIGAVPAIFLAFTQSPMLGLFTIALYFVIQRVENDILVPKIMEKAVGINPLVSIAVLMIGFQVAGVVGAMLAIPVATAFGVFVKDLFSKKPEVVL